MLHVALVAMRTYCVGVHVMNVISSFTLTNPMGVKPFGVKLKKNTVPSALYRDSRHIHGYVVLEGRQPTPVAIH